MNSSDYYEVVDAILKNLSADFMKKFGELKSSKDRYLMVQSTDGILKSLSEQVKNLNSFRTEKSEDVARKHRNRGNDLFKSGKLSEALAEYNRCIVNSRTEGYHGNLSRDPSMADVPKAIENSPVRDPTRAEPSELSLGLANRSVVMLKLSRFDECICDVVDSIDCGYPLSQRYKLLERIAVCHEHLGRLSTALECFEFAKRSLDISELSDQERDSQRKLITASVGRCKKRADSNLQTNDLNNSKSAVNDAKESGSNKSQSIVNGDKKMQDNKIKSNNNKNNNKNELHELIEKLRIENPLPTPSRGAIKFEYSSDVGNHAKAARDIKTGEVVMVDDTFARVLTPPEVENHCYFCFSVLSLRSDRVFPCSSCPDVLYCSKKCVRLSRQIHRHDLECPLFSMWKCSKTGPLAWLVVRILTSVGVENWRAIIEPMNMIDSTKAADRQSRRVVNLSSGEHPEKGYDDDDDDETSILENCRSVTSIAPLIYNLVSHSDKRKPSELLQYSILALWIVLLLKESKILNGDQVRTADPDGMESSGEISVVVGSIALKFLQIISCNGIEITTTAPDTTLSKCHPRCLGVALYPKISLFNHSCDPDLELLFLKDVCVARSIKPIRTGSPVNIDYGFLFYSSARHMRREHLKRQYFFTCMCTACTNDWPVKKELDRDSNVFPAKEAHGGDLKLLPEECPVCTHHSLIPVVVRDLGKTEGDLFESTNEKLEANISSSLKSKKRKKKRANIIIRSNVTAEADRLRAMEHQEQQRHQPMNDTDSNHETHEVEKLKCSTCNVIADRATVDELKSRGSSLESILQEARQMKINSNTIRYLELYLDCRYSSSPKRVTQDLVSCISTLKQCYRLLGNDRFS